MGFGNETIQGFSQGVMFAPVISTIPFVGYLFRLEEQTSGQDFVQTLRDAADPRWNICTEADETVVQQEGDKMCIRDRCIYCVSECASFLCYFVP